MKKLKFRKGSLVRLKSLHTVMNDPTLRIETEGSLLYIEKLSNTFIPYLGSSSRIKSEMDKKYIKIKETTTVDFSNGSYRRIKSVSDCIINEYLIEEVIKY